ncbi:class I SAM-dependent RNA methyltransferase [Candidatus Dojkabacteria bacterium]|uniref:Class I SAM-dependent RNA methyltransferase n=1 Tax=Candidatus Dojkabacteria bacterium TaxID=2099670 RepID=A0A955RL25_9BACT|nr:class I SAM-dependent RNA methyltransferase [Candidatus Dojkabacteria bacterium]
MIIDSNKKYKQFVNTEAIKLRSANKVNTNHSNYFRDIGSIPLEDINYSDQLAIKLKALKNIFTKIIPNSTLDRLEIVPSPETYEYRFRMDYVCSFNPIHEPNNRLGQRKAGKFNWVVDMEDSVLFSKTWFKKVREVYKKALELEIPLYDLVKHTGELRYLVVRQNKENAMLSIVTTNKDNSNLDKLLDFAVNQGFKSVNLVFQPSVTDTVDGEIVRCVGENYIEIEIGNKKFRVGANTFFQNNINAFKKIINFIKPYLDKNEILIDLYAGIGTLGIVFGDKFRKIYGYELVKDNVEFAKKNIELNGINHYEIFQKDLNDKDSIENLPLHQTLIVDPPRNGLEKNGVVHVLSFRPKQIIYISCNPVTQAADLKELINAGYKVINIRAFDLFPHTLHIENVVILEI